MIGALPVIRISVAEEAGASTVVLSKEGAVQAMASQLQVMGFIVTENDWVMPLFEAHEAYLVSIVRVADTAESM